MLPWELWSDHSEILGVKCEVCEKLDPYGHDFPEHQVNLENLFKHLPPKAMQTWEGNLWYEDSVRAALKYVKKSRKKCRISSQKNCKTSCSIVPKVPHNCIYLNACINGSFLLTWFLEFCLPEKKISAYWGFSLTKQLSKLAHTKFWERRAPSNPNENVNFST